MSFFEVITEFETNQYSVVGIGGGGRRPGCNDHIFASFAMLPTLKNSWLVAVSTSMKQ